MFTTSLLVRNVLFVLLFCKGILCNLPEWHMKPFGSHVASDKVDETYADDLISASDFAEKYVLPRKPLVFRNVVKSWPAYSLWTDEYLIEQFGDMEVRLEGKKEKSGRVPKGDICLGRDRLKTFLEQYKNGADKYIVSDLPVAMYKDVRVLPCMSCGEFLDSFVEIDIWINSDMGKKGNGGNSVIHKDAFNTVNCVLNGTKEWKLVELKYNDFMYQSWEGPMDAGYGGYSIMNPDKIDATKFPDVVKIPRWQFAKINAGDCIYLPSQMWHQVKSYGETNRAIATLFSMFNDETSINTTECKEKPQPLLLSEVDVDLQYSGKGVMPMGHMQMSKVKPELAQLLINETTGYITKKTVSRTVYINHQQGYINKQLLLKKAKKAYTYLLDLADGDKIRMNEEFFLSLTKAQFRPLYEWLFLTEPANSLTHEYSVFIPEYLVETLEKIQNDNNGVVTKELFFHMYCTESGGTDQLAEEFWNQLAGEEEYITDYSKTIEKAVEKYDYYRREDPNQDFDDEDRITTPQGHKSLPMKISRVQGEVQLNDAEQQDKEEENKQKNKNTEL